MIIHYYIIVSRWHVIQLIYICLIGFICNGKQTEKYYKKLQYIPVVNKLGPKSQLVAKINLNFDRRENILD